MFDLVTDLGYTVNSRSFLELAELKGFGAKILFFLCTIQGTLAGAFDGSDPRLASALAKQISQGRGSSFDVIVHITVDASSVAPLPVRGSGIPESRLSAVSKTTKAHLGEMTSRFSARDFSVRRSFALRAAYSARVTRRALAEILARTDVLRVEPVIVMQAHVVEGVKLMHADTVHARGWSGRGGSIAIIDTGVDPLHPALGGAPLPNSKVVYGLDTADGDVDPNDCNGHGTAVASIAAGSSSALAGGISFAGGVAPEATILAYKASPDGECGTFYLDDVVHAIDDAILHRDEFNVVAINLSFGGGAYSGPCDAQSLTWSSAVNDAVNAGIAVVVSAGNEGRKDGRLAVPACLTNAISVGAVYDADLEGTYRFCLDDDCFGRCTDSDPIQSQVTCYGNSSEYLSLVAPSEQLIAADRGGGLAEFGGTSGAAPYVTGAIAVLNELEPGIAPPIARLMLEVSGADVHDQVSDLDHKIVDLDAALTDDEVTFGKQISVAIPRGSESPARSTAVVDRDGYVADVEVTVRISHDKPQDLQLRVTSPDGTQVVLHSGGGGTAGEGGLFETYPVTAPSFQPLTRFQDHPARGEWHLEVFDSGLSSSGGGARALVGWALRVTTRAVPRPVEEAGYVIPVAAHAAGAHGTFWVSDLRILNRSLTDDAELRVALVPRGVDGLEVFDLLSIAVSANALLSLPDVVGQRFGKDDLIGNLVVETTSRELLLSSRTYNSGDADGVFGQYIGMASHGDSICTGDPVVAIIQLANTDAYRSNVGLSETSGRSVTVALSLFEGASGEPLGDRREFTVLPFSNLQMNVFESLRARDADNAFVLLEAVRGEGRVVAYGSVVDDLTGDAIYVPATRPRESSSFVVPVAAKASGLDDTNWVTDLRLFNPGQKMVSGRLEFRPRLPSGDDGPLTIEVGVGAGRVLDVDDVLGRLFGIENSVGSLRFEVAGGAAPMVVTSRTYNQVSYGTYGQFVNGVVDGFGTDQPATVIHLDSNDEYRTNLGITEVGGGSVGVRYVLKDSLGTTLGSGRVDLGPFEMQQIDDVARVVGVHPVENYRVDLYLDDGAGAFTAYASVVNNAPRADAILVPAAPL